MRVSELPGSLLFPVPKHLLYWSISKLSVLDLETDLLEIGLGKAELLGQGVKGVGLTNLPSTESSQRIGKRIAGSQPLSGFLSLHHSAPP